MSPEGASVHDAVVVLIDAADDDGGELGVALRRAFAEAQQGLDDHLAGPHMPEVEERRAELDAYLSGGGTRLGYAAWLLVLSYLSPEEQRSLQRQYEAFEGAAGVEIEFEMGSGEAEELMHALNPAEQLLVDLPYTTLDRSPGVDDYEQRRRSLSIEVTEEPDPDEPLLVVLRDGYGTLVATMAAGCYEQRLHWMLAILDPAPAREASRFLPIPTDDVRQAAREDLKDAVAWAGAELGDRYTIAPLKTDSG